MWQILNPEIRKATLDFSSSEQGKINVSQLYSGDIQLINAIELVNWDLAEDQFLVCEACGYVHCKSGDWVSLRRADPFILILPAFDSFTENEEGNIEYSPPWYIRKKGIAYLDQPTYESLRQKHSAFPDGTNFPQLNMREAILTFQWEAPLQIFGRPPKRFSDRDKLIIAASEGEPAEHIRLIEEFAQINAQNESSVKLRLATEQHTVISFYLDTAGFPEWKALAYDRGEMRLMLDSKYLIVPANAV
jgi:hypothetical protein